MYTFHGSQVHEAYNHTKITTTFNHGESLQSWKQDNHNNIQTCEPQQAWN